jgi:hypothetical protein
MRAKINSHLDILEQNILQELDDTEDKIKSKIDKLLQQLNLRYTINTKIQDIVSTITTFGSVYIETNLPSVVIKTAKDKQAQMYLSVSLC